MQNIKSEKKDYRLHYTTPVTKITRLDCIDLIRLALKEDAPEGDPSSESIFAAHEKGLAQIIAKETGILCGLDLLRILFDCSEEQSGEKIIYRPSYSDGQKIKKGAAAAQLSGSLRALLRLERVALNFLQYLSGISSQVERLVSAYGPKITLLDTRKTLPAYRRLAKYAVYCGGGTNHRIHLSDMVILKDNHIAASGSIKRAVEGVRKKNPQLLLEVEIDRLSQLEEVLALDVDAVLLDNMRTEDIHTAVESIRKYKKQKKNEKKPFIELSGNWTEERLRAQWKNYKFKSNEIGISMGRLTHTNRFLDLSMEITGFAKR